MAPRILVVGAGGVGGYFGAKLASQEAVTFLNRQGEHLSAMQATGLAVTDKDGTTLEVLPEQAVFTDTIDDSDPFDVVIFSMKMMDFTAEMIDTIKAKLARDALVFSLQNGVEATMQLADVLGEHVIASQCYLSSFKTAPGKIQCTAAQPTIVMFGERRQSAAFAASGESSISKRCSGLKEIFERAGLPADVPADADQAMWRKFVLSSVYPLMALGRLPFPVGCLVPETKAVLRQAMLETIAVARAYGVALQDEEADSILERISHVPVHVTCSTLKDVEAGKPSEFDALGGAVIRLGQSASPAVLTPTHNLTVALLLPAELRARGELKY